MNEKEFSPLDECKGLLTFIVSGQNFCADMADIVEIINPLELNQEENINSKEPHINLGVLKIQMIDLYKIYGFKPKSRTDDDRIIVMEINNKFFGFIVDKILNIYSLDKELKNEIEFINCNGIIHLSGILKFNQQNLFFLNSKRMISEVSN